MLLRRFILAHGYETSYTCLARRAAKTNNVWNRLVRRGSIGRRICVYGGLQLAFTLISCSVFLPTYFSYGLAVALQVGGTGIHFFCYFGVGSVAYVLHSRQAPQAWSLLRVGPQGADSPRQA